MLMYYKYIRGGSFHCKLGVNLFTGNRRRENVSDFTTQLFISIKCS